MHIVLAAVRGVYGPWPPSETPACPLQGLMVGKLAARLAKIAPDCTADDMAQGLWGIGAACRCAHSLLLCTGSEGACFWSRRALMRRVASCTHAAAHGQPCGSVATKERV